MPHLWINGNLIDDATAAISARDTGLLHGIGVFTTMRAGSAGVINFDRHLARFRDSCDTLFIPLLHSDDDVRAAVEAVLHANNLTAARLRITATRGVVDVDPLHGQHAHPLLMISATTFTPYPPELYETGMTVLVLDDQKLNPYDIQAGHKTLNYFSRLSALRVAAGRGAAEAIWFNVHNYLQSGSISNIFIISKDTLYTPPTNAELQERSSNAPFPYSRSNVLPGTTRAEVLDLARSAGIATELHALTISDLLDADEVFLTNSVMDIMPVCRIERKAIGSERPGPVVRLLSEKLRQYREMT